MHCGVLSYWPPPPRCQYSTSLVVTTKNVLRHCQMLSQLRITDVEYADLQEVSILFCIPWKDMHVLSR